MANISFRKLTDPTPEIAEAFDKWENDPEVIPFIHPNRDRVKLETWKPVTVESLTNRLGNHEIYLIYDREQLIGEVEYQADPLHLYKKEPGSAWMAIMIGKSSERGKGIGALAIKYLEEQVRMQGFQRIELGVFEFNIRAIRLYQRLGYQEIGRIDDFTFWQDRLWQDIRMEKYLK